MGKYKEAGEISSECQIFGTIPKYMYIHGLERYIFVRVQMSFLLEQKFSHSLPEIPEKWKFWKSGDSFLNIVSF